MYFYNLEIIVFFKRFSLNSSHVLLRFGQINHIVDRKGINALVSLLLWGYDPLHWALYKVYIYNEIKFCYEWKNLIFVSLKFLFFSKL